jgi:hypothetical protein
LSIDDIKKYFKEDHFTFFVVEANDLYLGFDLSKADEYDIAVKTVTQSFPGVGIDGKNVNAIVGGWKVTRILPTWIKDSNCWNQFVDDYVVEKEEEEEEEEEEEKEEARREDIHH